MAKIKIMLDPGHDYAKYNKSPVVPSYYEGAQMWRLYEFLKPALEKRGFTVGGTKSKVDQTISVTDRGRKAKGYNLLVSLHSNACDTESVDRPVGIYFVDDDCGKIDAVSKEAAVLLSKVVDDVMGTSGAAQQYSRKSGNDRDGDGRVNDDYYGVLFGAHQVGVAAIILEHSFHTNKRAAQWLMSDANLKRLAEAEADALARYYGMDTNVAPSAAETLAKKGVISSPDYWDSAQYRLSYLPELLEALADAAGSEVVGNVKTAQAAIQRLVDYHVIVSPGYWLENHGRVQYLDALLVSAANHIGADSTEPKWYRVRKSWNDADSQLGAFLQLEHAKLACPAGYAVYDWNGKVVYSKPGKSVDQLAREVINGEWGDNPKRRQRLEEAGYNYQAVQDRVNELLG